MMQRKPFQTKLKCFSQINNCFVGTLCIVVCCDSNMLLTKAVSISKHGRRSISGETSNILQTTFIDFQGIKIPEKSYAFCDIKRISKVLHEHDFDLHLSIFFVLFYALPTYIIIKPYSQPHKVFLICPADTSIWRFYIYAIWSFYIYAIFMRYLKLSTSKTFVLDTKNISFTNAKSQCYWIAL